VEDEAAGPRDLADDVDHIGAGDGDDVVGLDKDVLGGIAGFHEVLEGDLGDGEAAGGVGGGAGEGDGPAVKGAGDFDAVAGVIGESAGEGKDFDKGFAALELVDAGVFDGSDDGDGLGAEVGDIDGDVGLLDVLAEAGDDFGLELFDGESGGADAADHGEAEVAGHIDADGVFAELGGVDGADGDLVIGAEDVGGEGGRAGCFGRGYGRGGLVKGGGSGGGGASGRGFLGAGRREAGGESEEADKRRG